MRISAPATSLRVGPYNMKRPNVISAAVVVRAMLFVQVRIVVGLAIAAPATKISERDSVDCGTLARATLGRATRRWRRRVKVTEDVEEEKAEKTEGQQGMVCAKSSNLEACRIIHLPNGQPRHQFEKWSSTRHRTAPRCLFCVGFHLLSVPVASLAWLWRVTEEF